MPFTTNWIDPEVALEHQGKTIYHTYKNDDYDQMTLTYSFTTDGTEDCTEHCFEVRDLKTMPSWQDMESHPPYIDVLETYADPLELPRLRALWAIYHKELPAKIQQVLKEAIEAGVLSFPPERGAA